MIISLREDANISATQYITAHKFLKELKNYKNIIPDNNLREMRRIALSGDIYGAYTKLIAEIDEIEKAENEQYISTPENTENTNTSETRPIVRGKWTRDKYGKAICSVCENRVYILLDGDKVRANFCPICGAMLEQWNGEDENVKKRDRKNT